MKIKNTFLASLLTKIGHEVKAELVIDDASGTTLTFPDISDISEIAEGVAIDAADGTYTIANGEEVMTVVVVAGVVTSVAIETPEAVAAVGGELDSEVAAVLEAISDEVVALKAHNVKLVAELKDLKASLKHDTDEGKKVPAAADKKNVPTFKVI